MTVIVYSTGCPRCQVLERKLNDAGIAFEEVSDEEQMIELGIQGVPVLSVDGELMEFTAAVAWVNNISKEKEGTPNADRNKP